MKLYVLALGGVFYTRFDVSIDSIVGNWDKRWITKCIDEQK